MKSFSANASLSKTVLVLSLLGATAACSPAATNFASLEKIGNAVTAQGGMVGDSSGSSSIPVAGSGSSSGSSQVPVEVISSNPTSATVRVVDDVPFSATFNVDHCVNSDDTDVTFDLIKGENGKVRSAQITKLPQKLLYNKFIDHSNYSVYALYLDYEGKMRATSINTEVTLNNKRVYNHFNCNFQTSVIEDAAVKFGMNWVDLVPDAKLHFLADDIQPIGFAIRDQTDDGITMRCY